MQVKSMARVYVQSTSATHCLMCYTHLHYEKQMLYCVLLFVYYNVITFKLLYDGLQQLVL